MTTQDKRQPAFTDLDPMPFGQHKGEPLQDVPARYLWWLYMLADDSLQRFSGNGDLKPDWLNTKRKLANYIWNAKDDIQKEAGEKL